MTTLRTKSFSDLIQGYTAAVQASAAVLVDFTPGSVLRACGEAIGQVVLWLQGLILALLAQSRASTATGADLDSWMADYGLTRTAALFASGAVTFKRFTATGSGLVPLGSTVQSFDGAQQYVVTEDDTNSAWSATLNGYTMAIGIKTVTVPVIASTPGAGGNATVGSVSVINSAITGIDTVTNALAFSGGADVETDAAFRNRFVLYLGALSSGTIGAVANAVVEVQQGLTYTITENQNPDGSAHVGFFYVVVDDGTGAPSSGLLASVTAAVDAIRPVGTSFSVIAPTTLTATVVFKIAAAPGYLLSAMKAKAGAAVTAYINSLPLGAALPYSRIAQVAYDATAGIANVFLVTVNTATADLAGSPKQVIRAGTVTVNS